MISAVRTVHWGAVALLCLASSVVVLATVSEHFAWETSQSSRPTAYAVALMILAGLAFAFLARQGARAAAPTGYLTTAFVAMLIVGAVMRVAMALSTPIWEDDFYRYLWDGALLAEGLNPYAFSPQEAFAQRATPPVNSLALDHATTLERVNYPHLRTIYPGVAQAAFALARLFGDGLGGLRTVFIAADATAMLLLVLVLRGSNRSVLLAGLYWLNPLVAKEFVNAVHVDVLLGPLLLGAVFLAQRGRSLATGGLIGLAAGVKMWPLLLWPLFMRLGPQLSPTRIALSGAVAACLFVLAMAPLIAAGLDARAGLVAYAEGWIRNSAIHPLLFVGAESPARAAGWITVLDTERLVRVALALAGIAAAVALPLRKGDRGMRSLLGLAALILALSPAQYPWYWAALAPLAAVAGAWRTAAAIAVAGPLYYALFALPRESVLAVAIVWIEHSFLWCALFFDLRDSGRRDRLVSR